LVGIGAAVALHREAPLYLGTVLQKPKEGEPTVAVESPEARRAEVLIHRGVRFAKDLGVENVAGGTERARKVARGIVRVVNRHNPALLVLGYSDTGDPFAKSGRRFERLMDEVGKEVSCALAIVSLRGDFPFRRLLVPIAGPVNVELIADIVPALKRAGEAFVTFMHMVPSDADRLAARDRLRDLLTEHNLAEAGELVVRATENVQRALVRESAKYDLTVVGAPRQHLFARIFGDIAERVARESEKSVMIIRGKR
jgi:nucleotide-binding universal stress UspA family protein